jgi:DNA repair protein RadD
MSVIIPRPYQTLAIEEITKSVEEKDIVGDFVYQMCTGAGKSIVIAEVARAVRYMYPSHSIVMLAPTKELIVQNLSKLSLYFDPIDIGVMCAGVKRYDANRPLTLASIGTLKNRNLMSKPKVIIVDECHLVKSSNSGLYRKFIQECKDEVGTVVIGLTATAYNAYGHWLSCGKAPLFKSIFINPACQMKQLIEKSWLCPLKEVPIPEDLKIGNENLNFSNGDYTIKSIEEEVDPHLVDRVDKTVMYANSLNAKKIMCVTASIKHCEKVYNRLKLHGEKVSIVHAKVKANDREIDVVEFLTGDRRWICTPVALTTGFDCPELDMIVNFRHIGSKVLYVQVGGRGSRIFQNEYYRKEFCWFLDWTNTVSSMGPIDEITGRVPRGGVGLQPSKSCPECDAVCPINAVECPSPFCDHKFDINVNIQELLATGSTAPVMSLDHDKFKLVDDWKVERHMSKANIPSLKVSFMFEGNVVAREYLTYHPLSDNIKADRLWLMLKGKEKPPETDRAADFRSHELRCPDSIELRKRGKRYQLSKANYKDDVLTDSAKIITELDL